ncbi:hypothetical protein Clacol_003170 [Clathrus columnatus]|uniref:Major facilitator superfamily (MFS) profile domain-containing protein n=1 Tax=Clathrus columnatus TaxID=1419009 RepID=A0AAV5AAJ3_9AGAM|nr:hypothetical protein Clacol_003170 [Clathrus columnatus]
MGNNETPHLARSHAHEEDLPGTVNLNGIEGDDTMYGQALFPVPSEDPNDPLQWPKSKKIMILIICSVYSFLGNAATVGPSVYITLWADQFGVSPAEASGLISYPNLAFGFSSLILVPLYLKYGRRPVMLGSMALFLAGLIWASVANSFATLMLARVLHGFGSGVCEALPVQLVNDIFYLHERGQKIAYYTVCLCLGATGPLYAGYMLAGGHSWQLFFWVIIAFSGVLFILAFFFVEETLYKRSVPAEDSEKVGSGPLSEKKLEKEYSSFDVVESTTISVIPPRRSIMEQLKLWGPVDHDVSLIITMLRPFTYYFIPAVFWVVSSFGIYIGLGALAFNYTFPIKITAPPYNWSETNAGLIAIGNAIGYFLAIPFSNSSDRLAAYLTKKNNGIREAEMRLGVMLPAMVIAPAGLLVYGFTAQRDLHWFGYFAGVAMTNWGAYFYFSFTLAYAVDSYYANTSEMLIAMNLGKQAISFGMGLFLLDWVLQDGYAVVIAGVFVGIRILTNHTWLRNMHRQSAKKGDVL